jgi:hypothetical protein
METKKRLLMYGVEGLVIIFGILISLFLEQKRQDHEDVHRKNETLSQLVLVIDEDLQQIEKFIDLQNYSLESYKVLTKNLQGQSEIKPDSIIYHLSSVGRALRSFFPQQGTFNQLINSDLTKAIKSKELKTKLFKIYNEDLIRHQVHTKEYDQFFLAFNYRLTKNFFLDDSWDVGGNPVQISSYKYNPEYYRSDEVFADLIESKSSIINYISELDYLFNEFSELKELCLVEVGEH